MCSFVCAVDTDVNEGESVGEFTEQYRELELEEPYREQELLEGFEDGKFNHILWFMFCPNFYKHNQLACFTNCICFACWKHGWIATPWFVIIISWPPRLMSECVWTLIAARTLRTLNTIQLVLYKEKVSVCGKGKMWNFWKISLDGMDGISVWIAERCARTCVVEQGREISILSQLRTELVCHVT